MTDNLVADAKFAVSRHQSSALAAAKALQADTILRNEPNSVIGYPNHYAPTWTRTKDLPESLRDALTNREIDGPTWTRTKDLPESFRDALTNREIDGPTWTRTKDLTLIRGAL